MSKNMNNNPIEELRRMETPVSESEWKAILHDKRYVQKFGRKPKLSPKGRATLITGAVALCIGIPVLIKSLADKPSDTAKQTVATEVSVSQPTTHDNSSAAPQITPSSQSQTTSKPASKGIVSAVNGARTHEHSTLVAVTEARTISPEPAITKEPAVAVSTPQPSVSTTPARSVTTPTTPKPKTEPVISSQTDPFLDEVPKSDPNAEELALESDEFFIPSAFTPNGDGLNDLFYVKANFEPRNFEMTIINRNGERLFHTRDMNIGWDGMQRGNILPFGMYVYIIKYKDSKGNEQQKQGQILLIP